MKYASTFIAIVVTFLSCSSKIDDKNYIARVGNSVLTSEELNTMLPEISDMKLNIQDYVNYIVNDWIEKEIIFQKAKKFHLDKDEKIIARVNRYHRDLTIDTYLKYFIQTNITISEEEIKEYYRKNRKSFARDLDEAKVSHILVKDFKEAQNIRAALLSRDPKRINELHSKYKFETKVVTKGSPINELNRTIFETMPRDILGPIASDYGYHIIQVHERYEKGSIRSFEQVRDEIIQRLTQLKIQESYNRLIDSLMASEDYEINKNNLSAFLASLIESRE